MYITRMIILTVVGLFIAGCAGGISGKDPKTILARSFPMVRVEYEYDKFLVDAHVQILNGNPLAIKAGIFIADSVEKAVMTRVFQIDEKIEFMVPRNLLLDAPSEKIFRIEITGDDYEDYSTTLDIPLDGNLSLGTIPVKVKDLIVEGQILIRSNNQPLISAFITLNDSSTVVRETTTDTEGKFRFVLPGTMVDYPWFDLLIDTDGQYLSTRKRVIIDGSKYHNTNISMGATLELLSLGVEYRVNQNRVPFREGPENGARIKFLLGRGETFVVSKTAGDRVYGYIETLNDIKNFRTQDEGWVLIKHLDLIQ